LQALELRDRNAVYVALWTLKQNGVAFPESITFDRPYAEARPHLQAIREQLKLLPAWRLKALDESLAYHRQIYSPIWSNSEWP
jgi:hypothetical protein